MQRIGRVRLAGGPRLCCIVPPDLALEPGDQCIVEINRVPEFGVFEKFDQAAATSPLPESPPVVIRRATLQDRSKAGENAVLSKMAQETCQACAKKLGLDIRLLRVRYSFDRSVLTVLFAADQHIDTREMAKKLTADLHTRVDVRQIGVRDRAAIVGGLGACGRRLCCSWWLKQFESVNVKMAKVQRLSLNPSAIGGTCGRLKCCLRFEYDLYRELTDGLPRQGAEVACPDGTGCVVGVDVLRRRVRVRLASERLVEYEAARVRSLTTRREPETGDEDESTLAEWAEPESAGNS